MGSIVSLGAALLFAATEVKIAIPNWDGTNDVSAQKREFFVEYLSERLAAEGGVAITTAAQIAAILDADRQKQLVGCAGEGTSCLAELAGALGSEVLVVGNVARVGTEFAITLKAIEAKSGQVITSLSTRETREEALLDFLAQSASRLHADIVARMRGETVRGTSRLTPRSWAPALGGAASFVGSAVLFGLAKGSEARLRSADPSLVTGAQAHELATTGSTQQVASGVMLGVGIAAVVTAVIFYLVDLPPRMPGTGGPKQQAASLAQGNP